MLESFQYKECEFKYNAKDLSLTAFTAFCTDRKPKNFIIASGYDHFYSHTRSKESFCRHRKGEEFNQLTFKRKTNDANNFIRTEHNINLSLDTRKEQIEALCKEFSYEYTDSIFKNCFIYNYGWYTLVYYIIYDKDLIEKGRFFEIEMDENHDWKDEQDAWSSLLVMEKMCKPLGVSPQSRVKRSLFEMFIQKDNK